MKSKIEIDLEKSCYSCTRCSMCIGFEGAKKFLDGTRFRGLFNNSNAPEFEEEFLAYLAKNCNSFDKSKV